jgi:hypothetical protein
MAEADFLDLMLRSFSAVKKRDLSVMGKGRRRMVSEQAGDS